MRKNYGWKLFDNQWYISTVIGSVVPFGIILSFVCGLLEARYRIERNKKILYCAIGSMIYGVFMSGYIILVSYSGEMDTYALSLMYIPALFVSVYLFILYGVLSKRAKKFEQCILLIQNEHITSIPQIAEITGMSKKEVVSLLEKLIKMGGLNGAGISKDKNEVVFTKSIWARQKVVCKNCDASLVVNLGYTLICEFCGNPLEPASAKQTTAKKGKE